ncbi:MAG: hypothetical protein WCK73_13515 [Deltaproteobacteria bacterium]
MRRALAVALCSSLLLASCGRKREYPPPERYVPADAPLSVSVPALGTAARQAGALYRTIAQAPQAVVLAEAHAALKSQLGFDPLDPRGMEQAGVDPAGAAAAALGGATPSVLVLPILDLAKLDAMVARLSRDRMGASQRVTIQLRGVEVVTFRREGKGPAALAYTMVGPHALLAAGPDGPDALVAAAKLPEERSLWKSPLGARAREALGSGWLATVVAPAGSPVLADVRLARDGAALGVRAEAARLGLRVAFLLSPEREAWWKGLQPKAAVDEGGAAFLAPDAALLLRWAGDPAEAARRLEPWYPAGMKSAFAAQKIDPVSQLAPAFGPVGTVSLALSPTFTLTDFSSPRFDLRRVDPFSFVLLDAALPVRDPAVLRSFLARLQKVGPRISLKVIPSGPAAEPTGWTLSWGKGQLGLSLSGGRLLVAGGASRLPALETRTGGGGYATESPGARSALSSGLGGAVLDVDHLARAVEALPESAYGTGPNAVVMRSVVNRYLEPAASLSTISLRLDLVPGAAVVDLEVDGRSETKPRP